MKDRRFYQELLETLYEGRIPMNEAFILYKRDSLVRLKSNPKDLQAIEILQKGNITFILIQSIGKEFNTLD